MQKCSKRGQEVYPGNKFCTYCGTPVPQQDDNTIIANGPISLGGQPAATPSANNNPSGGYTPVTLGNPVTPAYPPQPMDQNAGFYPNPGQPSPLHGKPRMGAFYTVVKVFGWVFMVPCLLFLVYTIIALIAPDAYEDYEYEKCSGCCKEVSIAVRDPFHTYLGGYSSYSYNVNGEPIGGHDSSYSYSDISYDNHLPYNQATYNEAVRQAVSEYRTSTLQGPFLASIFLILLVWLNLFLPRIIWKSIKKKRLRRQQMQGPF